MQQRLSLVVFLMFLLLLTGCAGAVKANLKGNPELKQVAVVSLAISDWGGSVDSNSVGGHSVSSLMQGATAKMLAVTEKTLSEHWQVVAVKTFITSKGYRKAAEDIKVSVYSPIITKKEMPLFGPGFKKGDITPEKARELCKTLKVDAVVLVFSEWTQATGGFVPLTRAKTKNIVSFWDKNGDKIFYRRIDMVGKKVLGGLGIKAVNKETINEWTDSYTTSLEKMFKSL
ncbi:MAG: hypothetical protein K0A93_02130 [Desulfuromonadaceae bacterium]|nr:hypothetical protein [Desulfuromonadaceae bacterium]